MSNPKLHLIGMFHTIPSQEYSHCAFTGKTLRFPKMMNMAGWETVHYHNGESECESSTKVQLLTKEELETLAGKKADSEFHGATAKIGSPHWQLFHGRLIEKLKERLGPKDLIIHPFGHSHKDLVNIFKNNQHVESGIGYPDGPFGAFRIFESYSWMHYHQGKENRQGNDYEWVCPNYYDISEWTPKGTHGDYVLFMGRIGQEKGMGIVLELAKKGIKIVVAGQGDITPFKHENIEYIGPVKGKDRDELVGNALCMLMPTRFTEPFGGSGVEGMLTGTPLITSDFGAFSETVIHGETGFRCHTLQDYIKAINKVDSLYRGVVYTRARELYSLGTLSRRYNDIFNTILDLWGDGWYANSDVLLKMEIH